MRCEGRIGVAAGRKWLEPFIAASTVAVDASMEIDALLELTPEQVAEAVLLRRRLLSEQLPYIIRTLEESADQLGPQLEKATKAHREAQHRIADHKVVRDEAHTEAKALREEAERARSSLEGGGGLVSLDPKWKKDRLIENLQSIDERIETEAYDHRQEAKMLKERQRLVEQNEVWLKERRAENPQMAAYIDARRRMNALYKTGNKAHQRMIEAIKRADPISSRFRLIRKERVDTDRQLHRAKAILGNAERAVEYWERRLQDGFGRMEGDYEDLLEDANRVASGGISTSAIRRDERLSVRGEEE